LLGFLMACGGTVSDPIKDIPVMVESQNTIHVISFILMVDNGLMERDNEIESSLSEWRIKTGGGIDYKVVYSDMTNETREESTYKNIIKVFLTDPGSGAWGWTQWLVENNSARIYIKPLLPPDMLRVVMLHELGHAFNLSFEGGNIHYVGLEKSIMHPSVGDINLECIDIDAFCRIHDCKVNCAHNTTQSIAPKSNIIDMMK